MDATGAPFFGATRSQSDYEGYLRRLSELSAEYAAQAQELYADHATELGQLQEDASNRARQLAEECLQALRAAAFGDDFMERSQAAWMDYGRGYARLSGEFASGAQRRHRRSFDALTDLQISAREKALAAFLEHLGGEGEGEGGGGGGGAPGGGEGDGERDR